MTHDQVLWQILSALAVILTVIATRLQARREHKQTTEKITTLETAVNGTTSQLAARTEQLATTLVAVGVPVPPPGPSEVVPVEPPPAPAV